MIDYYAKSYSVEGGKRKYGEPLSSHLEKTLYYARELIKRYNIDDYYLIKAIEIAVAFHDIGKADYRFQDYLINGKSSTHKRVFHPLLGLPIVEKISDIEFNTNNKINSDNKSKNKIKKKSNINGYLKNLVVLAVASHHTALHQELYSQISQYDDIQFLVVADRKRFHKIVDNLCKQIGIDSIDLLDCYGKVSYQSLIRAKFDIPRLNSTEGVKLRELFVIIQGVLNYSDWLASEANNEKFFLPQLNLGDNFLDSPYDYQIKAKNTIGNIFITLPTGSGKTETALYWIAKNFLPGFRIFYALPTKQPSTPCMKDL